MKKCKILLLTLAAIILLSSCYHNTPGGDDATASSDKTPAAMSAAAARCGITAENFPKIDGSTSALPIVQRIFYEMYQSPADANAPETASKTVPSYELLIDGEVDMIIVPYASADVLAQAERAGVTLEFTPIAAEALVFITPKENETENITREQVREIYLDNGIKNWSALNGPDRALIPVCRNADSGSQSLLDNMILHDEETHPDIWNNFLASTMSGMLEHVAFYHTGGLAGAPTDSYALGYTMYAYLQFADLGSRLKMLSFDGIAPTNQSITDGSYPLTDAYYVVLRGDLPEDHSARRMVDWLVSGEGVEMITELRFLPLA